MLAFSLFTNDSPGNVGALEAAVRQSVQRAGSGGCAIWATIVRPPKGGVSYDAVNARLNALAGDPQLRGRLLIVPWAALSRSNPSFLGRDKVHATSAGYRERARLYAQAAESLRRLTAQGHFCDLARKRSGARPVADRVDVHAVAREPLRVGAHEPAPADDEQVRPPPRLLPQERVVGRVRRAGDGRAVDRRPHHAAARAGDRHRLADRVAETGGVARIVVGAEADGDHRAASALPRLRSTPGPSNACRLIDAEVRIDHPGSAPGKVRLACPPRASRR